MLSRQIPRTKSLEKILPYLHSRRKLGFPLLWAIQVFRPQISSPLLIQTKPFPKLHNDFFFHDQYSSVWGKVQRVCEDVCTIIVIDTEIQETQWHRQHPCERFRTAGVSPNYPPTVTDLPLKTSLSKQMLSWVRLKRRKSPNIHWILYRIDSFWRSLIRWNQYSPLPMESIKHQSVGFTWGNK